MLNKTPKGNAKKTKSAPRFLFVALILALILVASYASSRDDQPKGSVAPVVTTSNTLLLAKNQVVLERAETDAQRMQGLSDRDGLAKDTGMLFVFDAASYQCFWMKDMKFNIDMVWLDADKKVLKIDSNISPATYPNNFCSANTQYVIELSANEAARYGITIGQQLRF